VFECVYTFVVYIYIYRVNINYCCWSLGILAGCSMDEAIGCLQLHFPSYANIPATLEELRDHLNDCSLETVMKMAS
jgi:hypothetical protein